LQLNFKIKKQQIRCTNTSYIVSGSTNLIQAKFIFEDEYWSDLTKAVTFTNTVTGVSKKILLGIENLCTVPWEPMANAGLLNVYVEGMRDDIVVTTTMMRQPLKITGNGNSSSSPLPSPTPDIYQQILSEMVTRKDLDQYAWEAKGVFDAATHYDFPSVGDSNVIYKANQEKLIYQWNVDEFKYEKLSDFGDRFDLEIEQINGGSANGD
jgi:hypothetical protein